jgi:hypothetical protein
MPPGTERRYSPDLLQEDLGTWKKARVRDANVLNVSGQQENFLFYRGLGNFEIPLTISMPKDEVVIEASKDFDIPHVFVYENLHYGISRILWSGPMKAGETRYVSPTRNIDQQLPDGLRPDEVYSQFGVALMDAGLNSQEAMAMLRTWEDSYFLKPGLRVFWLVPRDFTDAILPMKITPAPTQLERVLVGRAEVLTPVFEDYLLTQYEQDQLKQFANHRYSHAYQERVAQLLQIQ